VTNSERSDAALAEHWLDTGGVLTLAGPSPEKQYPKRSELRRAEARAAGRRGADRRPAGGRPPGGAAAGHRPPGPSGARSEGARRANPYSNSSARLPVALAPRPAALPIAQTATASRPAGIDLQVAPQTGSLDAFHPPEQTGPIVPIAVPASPAGLFSPAVAPTGSLAVLPLAPDGAPVAPAAPPELAAPAATAVEAAGWGLDLAGVPAESSQDDEEVASRRTRRKPGAKSGGKKVAGRKTRAARLLVLALVVGAEGVALTTMTGTAKPLNHDAGNVSSAFELTQDQAAAKSSQAAASAALVPTSAAASAAGNALDALTPEQAQRDSSAGKVSAAIAQAKAAADRVRAAAARRAKILRDAQEDPKSVAKMLLADRGWGSGQFECLNLLWTRESGWNYRAENVSSGAYGIPQALPGTKMGTVAADWRTNPVTQIRWGLNYISSRYGTPCGAWGHETSAGWY
jgi:hypothetical protein